MLIIELFTLLSSLALGLLAGSLLTEAVILVPYWRAMDPKEFLSLHGTLGPRLYTYFAPLTILATVLPVMAATIPVMLGASFHGLLLVPASITLIMLAIYFGYFKGANDSFKSGAVGVDGLAKELKQWAKWHWIRVVLGISAFFVSLLALSCDV